MAVIVSGLPPALANAIVEAFEAAGHAPDDASAFVIGLGASTGTPLLDLEQGAWDAAVADARSAFFALRDAARTLAAREAGGSITVVVPVQSLRTSAGCGLAAVVGSFLTTAAQVVAVELGAQGIRVNVVAMGPLEGEAPSRVVDGVPLGRLARPGDVGAVCAALAAPGAAFVTGAIVTVDGGYAVTKAVGGSPFVEG